MKTASQNHKNFLRGVALILTTVAIFAVMDTLSKYLTRFYPVTYILWFRYLFHTLFLFVAAWPRLGLRILRSVCLKTQIFRGLVVAISSILFITTLKHLPIAEASAISFVGPIFVTIMAVLFLKEKVDTAQWVSIVCSFLGVLILIRPGSAAFSWAALLPMLNALFFAGYQILSRQISGRDNPYTSTFYGGLIGTLIFSAMLPFDWVIPNTIWHGLLLVLAGILGGSSHLLMIKAYQYASAAKLAPFSYTQLVWVTLSGYFIFGEFPDRVSLIGIAIILLCGIFSAVYRSKKTPEIDG